MNAHLNTFSNENKATPTSVTESIRVDNKKAYKVKKIHVYCPEEDIELVKASISELDFGVTFNNYEIDTNSERVICHYNSALLPEENRDYLVYMTEIGEWVEPLVSYLDRRLGYTSIELLQPSYFLHQKAFSILSNQKQEVRKRTIDFLGALIILVITFPIMLMTAIFIKLTSTGPVIYSQKRVGRFNKEFNVYKFRSMRVNAEKDGAVWAKKNDDRVTLVGRFIRKTRIDELPQLINVIKGEMSLIGPRPERDVFIQELERYIPYYRFRHAVKPGLTGLAQVRYPYGASVEDAKWKHRYDIHYIKHHRILSDIKIMFLTVKVIFLGMGR